MGNTTATRRRSGEDPNSPTRSDGFPGQKFLYQPSEDTDEPLHNILRSHMQDAQYEPVSMRKNSRPDRPLKLPTFFKWDGKGSEVYVSGTFNQWKKKIPLVKSQGTFYTIVDLPEGEHQYKFYVDGDWVHDHSEPVLCNPMGTSNNVVHVKPTDFEVFDALNQDGDDRQSGVLSSSPPGQYSQQVPERHAVDVSTGNVPLLPPHLLQVLLNKNIPISCEPTLLPEPNHVMLNHLYALSIKDGVMVLSATHRYRKKFVTTLLYKPIQ